MVLLLAAAFKARAQTSIYIIGTVHERTRNFNADTILNILTALKPSLILLELDSSFFDKDFNLSTSLRSNEILGVRHFVSRYPAAIRPFDVNVRGVANEALAAERKSLHRLSLVERKLDSAQRRVYLDFIKSDSEALSFVRKKPYEINSMYVNELIERNQGLMYNGLLAIIESRSDLADLRIGFRQCGIFWDWRNKKMVDNTIVFLGMEAFRNKTIVLFTGFFHKYYFLNALKPMQDRNGFVIREYYK
jgi:hypothetical protein